MLLYVCISTVSDLFLLQVILQHLDVERKEKEELLAEEQRNVNEKLKALEKEQLRCLEKAKKVEVC